MRQKKMKQEIDAMRKNSEYIPQVNANELWMVSDPLPHERAVLILAKCYQSQQDGPDYWVVSNENQQKAVAFYNEHGLARTLDECCRIDCRALEGIE